MRADSELVYGNSIESLKDDSKLKDRSEHDCEETETELKIPEDGKKNECEMFCDKLDRENDGDLLECCFSEGMNEKIQDDRFSTKEKEGSVLFMDKKVTACDLPEIVVCYKEGSYHVVKDICVDEGVPLLHARFSSKEKSDHCSSEDSVKAEEMSGISESVSSERNLGEVEEDPEVLTRHGDGKDSVMDVRESRAEESRICSEDEIKDDGTGSIVVEDMPAEIDSEKCINTHQEVDLGAKESITLADILSMEDGKKALNNGGHGREEQSSEDPLDETEDSKTAGQGDTYSGDAPELCNDSETLLRSKNYVLEDSDDHTFSSHLPNGLGEASFSAAEPVSGHITYSGPIAFSGSLSVRSDASTTSTRSFAFPVLQSEWNSSPVRMAKADKRRLRSQKGWRHTCLCCRF